MIILLLPIFITVSVTIIAAYFDLKKGIIPNKLTLFLFVFGIAINSLFSIFFHDSSYVLNSIIISIITFLLCYILWKIKLWAGGDVKLLTAITAAIYQAPNILNFQFLDLQFPLIAIYPFPLTLIFNSILISFPFLIIFLVFNSYIHHFKTKKSKYSKILNLNVLKSKILVNKLNHDKLLDYFSLKNKNKNYMYKYMDLMDRDNIKTRFKNYKNVILKKIMFSLFFSVVFLVFTGIYSNIYYSLYFLSFSILFSLISSFLFKLIKNFKNFIKIASNKEIAIFNLNEGMIIGNLNIIIDKNYNKSFNKLIHGLDNNKSNINIKKINYEKSNEKQLKYTLSSSTAAGLTLYDISFIKKLFNNDFIHETVPIKIGIPFAPSIAIAFLITIFIGDLCLLLLKLLNNILNHLQII
ncbi:MAG: A24 family peptidase [Methanobrevibacter sp.]|nr:A24 family peptidase [Methanobrevibacter sp.]